MKRLTAFFASLYLVLLLSAPIVTAGENHGGFAPPPPDNGGGNTVLPDKGNFVLYQMLSFVLSLDSTIPLI
jgi:hypothetical protein